MLKSDDCGRLDARKRTYEECDEAEVGTDGDPQRRKRVFNEPEWQVDDSDGERESVNKVESATASSPLFSIPANNVHSDNPQVDSQVWQAVKSLLKNGRSQVSLRGAVEDEESERSARCPGYP